MEVYVVVNAVAGLERGLYHYAPQARALECLDRGFMRRKIVQCSSGHEWLTAAPAVLVLTCHMRNLYWKYGRRAYRMIHIDAGILAQTLHLVATGLGLASCLIGGYEDAAVHDLLRIDGRDEFVALLLSIGRPPAVS
jgi:SagB-type dehydrogenase family enzyme